MSFREVEPEADLPRTDNENPNDPEEIEVIQNAVEYIKLVKIDHQALILVRKFLTKVVTPEETIPQGLFLHQAMLAWKANLPARLQLAPNMSPHTPFVAMLHILYHACAIMIQRCYCEDPSVSHLDISNASRATCTVSATNITVIIDDLYTNHGMLPLSYPIRGCYFIIYCLIAAATIQVTDIRMGGNGTIMFKRSLALLNLILRKSTAVDIEKEVELLKSSMDAVMESNTSSAMASGHQQDQRPTFKPILPMSQKYGSKLNFSGSGSSPIRIRKISPRVSSTSSAGVPSPSMGALSQSLHSGNNQPRDSSSAPLASKNLPVDLPQPGRGSQTGITIPKSASSNSGACESNSAAGQSAARNQSDSLSPPQSLQDDDLDLNIKSSPSPDMGSRSLLSNFGNIMDGSVPGDETFLRSVPTFTVPSSLPTDFNAFAQAQQQALGGSQNPPPLMSLAQLLVFQQEQQRLQQQQQHQLQQQHQPQQQQSLSLDQLTAAQIQEQHQLNQQRQALQLQQQQQQLLQQQRQYQLLLQQQDPALVSTFLSNFSNLTNYQQLNSDQAQNELLSMLDSTMFNNNNNGTNFDSNNSFGLTPSFLQQHASQQSSGSFQPSMSPSSASVSSTFSPDMNNSTLSSSDFSSSAAASTGAQRYQQQDQHRTFSSDDSFLADAAAMGRPNLHDTPSPESFPVLDLAGSFPTYLGSESAVPFGVRQALGDVGNIFKFEASHTGLSAE